MYVKKNLLLWVAVFALALPLLLTGTASAKYMDDGAVPAQAGGFITPTDGICVVGLHADGTIDVADGITNQRDCLFLNAGTMNGGTAFDLRTLNGLASCGSATTLNGGDGAKHTYNASRFCGDSSGIGKSLKDLDRTQQICEAIGGIYAGSGNNKCVAYGWQYRGQNASGAPLAWGTKGTSAGAGTGFCYTAMRTNITPTTSCPSTSTNSSTAFGYSVSGTNCVYAYGINGPVNAAMSKVDGTSFAAAGATKDLSLLTTYGECLANGGSWSNWILMPSSGATTANGITAAVFDLTRQAVSADEGCIHCHSTKAQANGPAERWKDSYLKTGHKNMLRKVVVGNSLTNADGAVYTTDGTNAINMAAGTINVGGVDKNLRYIYGDWMIALPSVAYEGGSAYTCASCHTAGYSDTQASGGPGVQSIGTPGYTAKQPADSGAGYASVVRAGDKWDLDGIGCGRCHNATVPSVTSAQITASSFPTTAPTGGGMGALAAGTGRTNLCFGCHQSIAKAWPSNTTQYDPTLIPTGISHGAAYGRDFNGHVIGSSFLNSVHGKYAGVNSNSAAGGIKLNSLGKYDLFDPNGTTEYGSIFKGYTCWQTASGNSPAKTKADGTEIKTKSECETLYGAGTWRADATGDLGTQQGTCSTCHDVHNSLFVESQAEAAMRKTCEGCHVNNATTGATDAAAPQVVVANINHPTGGSTPFDAVKYEDSCAVCHMATQAIANGDQNAAPVHVWRINTSASYNTFPTMGQFYGGVCSKHTGAVQNALTVPAVYLSDTTSAACTAATGTWTAVTQDRNAQIAADGTYAKAVWVDLDLACGQCHGARGTAHLISKAGIAPYAQNMHDGGALPTADCKTCHATVQNGKAAIIGDFVAGKNHHGAVPGLTANCIGCHARAGVAPANWQTNAFCRTCHSPAPGAHQLVDPRHPNVVTCSSCHSAGGVTPNVATDTDPMCGPCHGGSGGAGATHNGAPYLSVADLTVWANGMHTVPTPTTPTPPIVPSTSAFSINGFTATYADHSTGGSGNLTVLVTWGDGKTSIITAGTTTTHVYTRARIYNAKATVFDKGVNGTQRKMLTAVTAPLTVAPLSISGLVTTSTGTPLQGVVMTLEQVTTKTIVRKKAVTRADGTYTFNNVLPNAATGPATSGTPYTLVATKKNFTFPAIATFSVTNLSVSGKNVAAN